MKVKIKGLNQLKQTLNQLSNEVENGVYGATVELTETVASKAVSNLQSSMQASTGELANSIKTNVEKDNGNISGSTYSDNPVSVYREFGTGPVGEASKKDLPSGITPVYTQEAWFIPVTVTGVDLNEVYGIPKVTIKGKEFYYTHGQPARPFLYPAFKETMQDAEDIYQEHISKALKKVAK